MGKRILHVVRSDLEAGQIIGYTRRGPVYAIGGAAGTDIDVDNWIPVEMSSQVIMRVKQASAIEGYAIPTPMSTATKDVPRSGGVKVAASTTYTDADDDTTNDKVTLHARRFIARVTIDEDDLNDALPDVLAAKGLEWATSYAKVFDNACLAVTAAENGTTIPFTSVYKSLTTTNSATGYTANDNVVSWNGSVGTSGYSQLSKALGKVEESDYFSLPDMRVIAHPAFRAALREIKDANARPIFIEGLAGTPDTLFNIEISWTNGAKTSATNSQAPAGNPLLFFCNRTFLQIGIRSGPETLAAPARPQDDTDDHAVKYRTRRGFVLGHERAVSVVEKTG